MVGGIFKRIGGGGGDVGSGPGQLVAKLKLEVEKLNGTFKNLHFPLSPMLKAVREAPRPLNMSAAGGGSPFPGGGGLGSAMGLGPAASPFLGGGGGGGGLGSLMGSGPSGPTPGMGMAHGAMRSRALLDLVVRLSYIAVLRAAMDRALYSESLDIATAIGELLARLEAIKRIDATSPGAPGGGSGMSELSALRDAMQAYQHLLHTLGEILRRYDEVSQSV